MNGNAETLKKILEEAELLAQLNGYPLKTPSEKLVVYRLDNLKLVIVAKACKQRTALLAQAKDHYAIEVPSGDEPVYLIYHWPNIPQWLVVNKPSPRTDLTFTLTSLATVYLARCYLFYEHQYYSLLASIKRNVSPSAGMLLDPWKELR